MTDSGSPPSAAEATVLTGPGRGAISVIRVRGCGAVPLVASVFRGRSSREWAGGPTNRPRFGRLGGERGDEVVVVKLTSEHVEIHGHGGSAAVGLILDALAERGATISEAAESSGSRWVDIASGMLADAPTLRTAQILLDQAEGALDRELQSLRSEIDSAPLRAASRVDALRNRANLGLRLIRGWRVALTGRPNVGKSHLINAIAGFERAVVSPTAGTTRDVVRIRTAIEGWPVELSDSAGLHESREPLEAAGIRLARRELADADLVIVVLDRSEPLRPEDRDILDAYPGALLVANKADLIAEWAEGSLRSVPVSAATGTGMSVLLSTIARRIVPIEPAPGSAVPIREELVATLDHVKSAIERRDLDSARRALAEFLI